MHKVDLKEAERRLAELIEEAASGEEVVIERGDGATFRIVPIVSKGVSSTARGEKMAEALAKLAEVNAFPDIEDPVRLQRDIRQDRVLPGREG